MDGLKSLNMADHDKIISVAFSTYQANLRCGRSYLCSVFILTQGRREKPQDVTTSTFIPNNDNPSRTVDSQHIWHTELSDDSLDELQTVKLQDEGVQMRKRMRPPVTDGHSLYFTPVWEDQGERDAMDQKDGSPPRKKRAAPKTRSQSLKTLFITSPRVWDQEDRRAHPSAPTASSQNFSDEFAATKCKPNQSPLFRNPVITKPPSYSHGKHIVEDRTQQEDNSLIKYQGFVTSQESVQPSTVPLARTTMEKLVAFRCEPSSTKSKKAARAWWTSSGRPINESLQKRRGADTETLYEPQACAPDATVSELSKE